VARKAHKPSGVQLGDEVVRAMVLQGAAKLFASQGARSPGVEDLLKAARISRRTFYRVYAGKEDVLLTLYRLGTERLLNRCRIALEQETDPLRVAERCIDAHLQTAREQPRLMFVLGGEAHRQESLLHPLRVEAHETLATMMASRARTSLEHPPDKLLFRALLFALEGVTRLVLEEGDQGRHVVPESFERARVVMLRLAAGALVDA
jgi:AcrR family transcriptional regulator